MVPRNLAIDSATSKGKSIATTGGHNLPTNQQSTTSWRH